VSAWWVATVSKATTGESAALVAVAAAVVVVLLLPLLEVALILQRLLVWCTVLAASQQWVTLGRRP
jgi:hypothetical protein